jgi:hypothetical protein
LFREITVKNTYAPNRLKNGKEFKKEQIEMKY